MILIFLIHVCRIFYHYNKKYKYVEQNKKTNIIIVKNKLKKKTIFIKK